MKKWFKAIAFTALMLAAVLLATACSDPKGYEIMNNEGYTVSVKFDANGGAFTTGVTVMVDSYNPENVKSQDSAGNKLISLIEPNDEQRGTSARYDAINSGYFLAGWYQTREEVKDEQGNLLDIEGNVYTEGGKPQAYSYSDRWDFGKDKLVIDPSGSYSADEPVITLYAAWIPLFTAELKDIDSGEIISTYTFNPVANGMNLSLPAWNEKGVMSYNDFSAFSGSFTKSNTFDKAYYDSEMTRPIDLDVVSHTGQFDVETATAKNTHMTIYAKFLAGNWFKVSTPEQFKEHAKAQNNLFIEADLDFTDKSEMWEKTYLTTANFKGAIIGKGHVISGITIEQKELSESFGLFGSLSDGAVIDGVDFKNITVIISKGSNPTKGGTTPYGILAGNISDGATVKDVTLTDSKLVISPDFTTRGDYSFGLVAGKCSFEDTLDVEFSGVSCEAMELENPKNTLIIEIDGQSVHVEIEEIQN